MAMSKEAAAGVKKQNFVVPPLDLSRAGRFFKEPPTRVRENESSVPQSATTGPPLYPVVDSSLFAEKKPLWPAVFPCGEYVNQSIQSTLPSSGKKPELYLNIKERPVERNCTYTYYYAENKPTEQHNFSVREGLISPQGLLPPFPTHRSELSNSCKNYAAHGPTYSCVHTPQTAVTSEAQIPLFVLSDFDSVKVPISTLEPGNFHCLTNENEKTTALPPYIMGERLAPTSAAATPTSFFENRHSTTPISDTLSEKNFTPPFEQRMQRVLPERDGTIDALETSRTQQFADCSQCCRVWGFRTSTAVKSIYMPSRAGVHNGAKVALRSENYKIPANAIHRVVARYKLPVDESPRLLKDTNIPFPIPPFFLVQQKNESQEDFIRRMQRQGQRGLKPQEKVAASQTKMPATTARSGQKPSSTSSAVTGGKNILFQIRDRLLSSNSDSSIKPSQDVQPLRVVSAVESCENMKKDLLLPHEEDVQLTTHITQLEELKRQFQKMQEVLKNENAALRQENFKLQDYIHHMQQRVKNILNELQCLKQKGDTGDSGEPSKASQTGLADACLLLLSQLSEFYETGNSPQQQQKVPLQLGPISPFSFISESELRQLMEGAAKAQGVAGAKDVSITTANGSDSRRESGDAVGSNADMLQPAQQVHEGNLGAVRGPILPCLLSPSTGKSDLEVSESGEGEGVVEAAGKTSKVSHIPLTKKRTEFLRKHQQTPQPQETQQRQTQQPPQQQGFQEISRSTVEKPSQAHFFPSSHRAAHVSQVPLLQQPLEMASKALPDVPIADTAPHTKVHQTAPLLPAAAAGRSEEAAGTQLPTAASAVKNKEVSATASLKQSRQMKSAAAAAAKAAEVKATKEESPTTQQAAAQEVSSFFSSLFGSSGDAEEGGTGGNSLKEDAERSAVLEMNAEDATKEPSEEPKPKRQTASSELLEAAAAVPVDYPAQEKASAESKIPFVKRGQQQQLQQTQQRGKQIEGVGGKLSSTRIQQQTAAVKTEEKREPTEVGMKSAMKEPLPVALRVGELTGEKKQLALFPQTPDTAGLGKQHSADKSVPKRLSSSPHSTKLAKSAHAAKPDSNILTATSSEDSLFHDESGKLAKKPLERRLSEGRPLFSKSGEERKIGTLPFQKTESPDEVRIQTATVKSFNSLKKMWEKAPHGISERHAVRQAANSTEANEVVEKSLESKSSKYRGLADQEVKNVQSSAASPNATVAKKRETLEESATSRQQGVAATAEDEKTKARTGTAAALLDSDTASLFPAQKESKSLEAGTQERSENDRDTTELKSSQRRISLDKNNGKPVNSSNPNLPAKVESKASDAAAAAAGGLQRKKKAQSVEKSLRGKDDSKLASSTEEAEGYGKVAGDTKSISGSKNAVSGHVTSGGIGKAGVLLRQESEKKSLNDGKNTAGENAKDKFDRHTLLLKKSSFSKEFPLSEKRGVSQKKGAGEKLPASTTPEKDREVARVNSSESRNLPKTEGRVARTGSLQKQPETNISMQTRQNIGKIPVLSEGNKEASQKKMDMVAAAEEKLESLEANQANGLAYLSKDLPGAGDSIVPKVETGHQADRTDSVDAHSAETQQVQEESSIEDSRAPLQHRSFSSGFSDFFFNMFSQSGGTGTPQGKDHETENADQPSEDSATATNS